MKVVLLNTYDVAGGAAIACNRLFKALQKEEVDVKFLVNKKTSSDPDILTFNSSGIQKALVELRLYYEQFTLTSHLKSKKDQFLFSRANTGIDISNHPAIRDADLIHLHWPNHGFLSLRSLKRLAQLNKKIVWTLHDMWTFTGGCHYSRSCERFKAQCGKCPYLKGEHERDLSFKVLDQKTGIYDPNIITFVTCSKWLSGIAKESSLLNGFDVQHVPNPIDTDIFRPVPKEEARQKIGLSKEKFYILFGSMNISDERKGFKYFKLAINRLIQKSPTLKDRIELLVFGKSKEDLSGILPIKVNVLGKITEMEKIVHIYNAANIFLLPSLEDNLPNTVMESLSCGTPVVAFDVGGIPEMVEHKSNGYLAQYKSDEDLANGIHWILDQADEYDKFSDNSRRKVLENFKDDLVVKRYIKLYENVLAAH